MISRFTQAPAPLKVLVGVGIAIALLALVIFLPKWSFVRPGGLTTAVDRAKAETDLRGHLIQVVGGLVLALGAYFTWRTLRLNQEGHRLNQEGQITERFTRAVEQLANDDQLDIRIGGIYALERIAHDSETHYEPVMEVLTAFLREHSPWPPRSAPKSDSPPEQTVDKGSDSADGEPSEVPALRVDFQAVATVLGRRDRRHQRALYRLDLTGVDLRNASLFEAKLSRDDLSWANLSRVDLSWADLSWADLTGADLNQALLPGADLSAAWLFGADLSTAIGLTVEQLDKALTNNDTKLPEHLGGEQSDGEDDEDG